MDLDICVVGRAGDAEKLQRIENKAEFAVGLVGNLSAADHGSAVEVAAFRMLVSIKHALVAQRTGHYDTVRAASIRRNRLKLRWFGNLKVSTVTHNVEVERKFSFVGCWRVNMYGT